MDFEEARALGHEIVEIVKAGGDIKRPLEDLFKRYQVADLNDELRKKAQTCEAETLPVLEMTSRPTFSTEVIADVTVGHFGNSWETLECCGELNVLLRKYVSWTGGNSRWGIREERYARYELLSYENAIAWIQRLHPPAGE